MKLTWIVLCSIVLWSCSNTEETEATKSTKETKSTSGQELPVDPDDLIEVRGNVYTEYYDAEKSKIKFQGEQDAEKRRHGKWVHYHENGLEAGVTFYIHGKRNGFSSVKRPNGAMYYHGEYKDDKPVGVWKYYDESGKFLREYNYDTAR